MLKKFFTIGTLASLMFVAFNANAQEKSYAPEYPRYGFWSNWSLGGSVFYSWQYGTEEGIFDWSNGSNIGLNLFAEKELNHIFAVRLRGEATGLVGSGIFDRYGLIMADGKMSLNGLCKGYDPERKCNVYLMAGFGGNILQENYRYFGLAFEAGIGASLKLCDNFTMFAELRHDFADIINPVNTWRDCTGKLAIGAMYNFGPTQNDLDLIAQRAMLTQENFDKMNNEIDGLRNDLRDAKTREAKLMNRINELESTQNENTFVRGRAYESGVADSLRKIIEGYETNKHNFYALPFSILYGIDEYTVSEDQMKKINAIAQIMKDNEDVNFEIIGYCDYSGSDAYNQKLSEKRAENVKKLLVRKGISEDRLTISGKGKSMSFGDIKNAVNRRVSFYRVNK